jgi:PAS domain S-box-containing protein
VAPADPKSELTDAEAVHRLQAILDAIPAPIWFKDVSGVYLGCNAAFEAYLGRPRAQIVGASVYAVAPPDLAEIYRSADEALLRAGGTQEYETEVGYADGRRRRVIMRKSVLLDSSGEVTGLAGTMLDVSEQRRAEAEHREAEARARSSEASFRALVEASPGLVVIHRGGQVLYANPALRRLVGLEPHEVAGQPLLAWIHPSDRGWVTERLLEHERTGAPDPDRELRLVARDGRIVEVEFAAITIEYDGAPARASIGRDLTERKQAQARLALSDRLASIGTLAAGVAHELNNPLTFVLSNLSFATGELHRLGALTTRPDADAVADLTSSLEEARQGADRMRVIVRDLRALSRQEEAAAGTADVDRAIEYACGLAASQVKPCATLVRDLAALPPVLGSEARLGQVFLNLIVNAAHAIPPGHPTGNEIRISTRRTGDGRVAVEVRDSGVGMSAEVRQKIFDPFFTTKPGLGLWVCHNLVRAHGGDIEVESEPGRGSTFRVLLPEAPELSSPPPEPAPVRAAAPRRRVLVVDDEPLVGAAIRRQLVGDYEVEVAIGGVEALRRLAAGSRFDAVVCDVMMPDMGGVALRDELVRRSPSLAARILFITGGADTLEGARLIASGAPWIEKPFDRTELLAAIDARIEAGA